MTHDPLKRCGWAVSREPFYVAYHDGEWGVPVHDDQKHFEMLILEGAQAGLSWETILRRREGYRQAFLGFVPEKVAHMRDEDLEALRENPAIIRNKLKINAARQNTRVFLDIQKEVGSFDAYLWSFVGGSPLQGRRKTMTDVPVTTKESDALSKDLKKRGMSFVGSTIMYAYMQAVGLVNDHTADCFCYARLKG
ncbi:MAG: DNA-3-methyladenine glycosylase I [Alphaproteobacteria bacterium]|nr:DNA-3-methyladenine glycosylase I [Alphaproteobacteria bacterium]